MVDTESYGYVEQDPLDAFVTDALLSMSDEQSAAMTPRLVQFAKKVSDEGPPSWGTQRNRAVACVRHVEETRGTAGAEEARRAWRHVDQGQYAETEEQGRACLAEASRTAAQAIAGRAGAPGIVLGLLRRMIEATRSATPWQRREPPVPSTGGEVLTPSEPTTLDLLRASDEAAWTQFYRANAGRLRAWLRGRYYRRSPADLEDIAQEAFASVFGAIETADPAHPLEALLFHMAKRRAIDFMRKVPVIFNDAKKRRRERDETADRAMRQAELVADLQRSDASGGLILDLFSALTVEEVADKHHVSVRTIQRDILAEIARVAA